ncbi:MAG: GntR family transcriptional regulator [Thermodesulfobacteriota bacterium]
MEPILPVYHQIRRTIKHWILDKNYCPNDRIPPEQELASQFNVNRMTVRQALSSLVKEGLLIRKRGEGTFVTDNEELIRGLYLKHISMTNELFLPLVKAKTLSVVKTEIAPSPLIREKLELGNDDRYVIRIKRDRLVPEGSRAFTTNYLPLEIGRRLEETDLLQRPLSKIMEDDLKIKFIEAYQTIEASFADKEAAEHLGVPVGVPTLVTERIMYAEKGKPVELVNTIYAAGQYKCCFQLKKVKRKTSFDWICQITG